MSNINSEIFKLSEKNTQVVYNNSQNMQFNVYFYYDNNKPSKTIPQGISASLSFDRDASFEENFSKMKESISRVLSGICNLCSTRL